MLNRGANLRPRDPLTRFFYFDSRCFEAKIRFIVFDYLCGPPWWLAACIWETMVYDCNLATLRRITNGGVHVVYRASQVMGGKANALWVRQGMHRVRQANNELGYDSTCNYDYSDSDSY